MSFIYSYLSSTDASETQPVVRRGQILSLNAHDEPPPLLNPAMCPKLLSGNSLTHFQASIAPWLVNLGTRIASKIVVNELECRLMYWSQRIKTAADLKGGRGLCRVL